MSGAASDVILQRMMSLHPKIIDLTLDRVHRLLARLGHPERRLPPVIHIAGTNGKGSTLAMIRAGLEAEGARVHAYTSPHLVRFHERIRLAGTLIGEAELAAVLDECEQANDGAPITYFEITTCAAFLAMSRVPADFTLLEVGLGGRLDATNVIAEPRLTIITPVSRDHEQYLGDTIAAIAREKAGIIKPGVPVVVGPQPDEALEVIESMAARQGAPLVRHGQEWQVWQERGRLVFQDETGLLDLPRPVLPGAHQIANAGVALAALRTLGRGEDAFEGAMKGANWPARLEHLRRGRLPGMFPQMDLWLDGGHNPAAGEALAAHLRGLPARPTVVICGMLDTKDSSRFLAPLADVADGLVAVPIPDAEASLPAEELAGRARRAGHRAQAAGSVREALEQIARTTPAARVVICGSLYLAGAVLRENGRESAFADVPQG